jgi:hypothetical protein
MACGMPPCLLLYLARTKFILSLFQKKVSIRDGDRPIDRIPGLSNTRLNDMQSFIRTSNNEIMFDFMGSEAQN